MTTYPFCMDDKVLANGKVGTVVMVQRRLYSDTIVVIAVKFDDNDEPEWFFENKFDDIELVEEA